MTSPVGPRKPRLLVLASTYPRWKGDHEPGFVHELARRMTDEFDVHVLCPHSNGSAAVEEIDGVEVHRYRYAPTRLETLVNDGGIVGNLKNARWKWLLLPGFLLAQVGALWRLNRRWRPDVVHAHWLLPQGLAMAVLGLVDRSTPPFLVTSHGADLFALRGRWFAALKRYVLRRAAAATVVSSAMRDELKRIGADTAKVEVAPMGVDLSERFVPEEDPRRSPGQLLFVGRLVEKKGLRVLLDAMPEILTSCPGAHLVVAGFGPELEDRKAQAVRLGVAGKVDFVGPVAQEALPELYRSAAVFVAPFVQAASGDREGLGLVVVEAAGCGCPLVVSDLPAVRQIFPDGVGVSLVVPGDARALAEAVTARLADPGTDGLAVRERLRSQFNWPRVAERYARLLVACADRHAEDVA